MVETYRHPNGLLYQCMNCRKMQHPQVLERWDWMPAWVDEPLQATRHTLCDLCIPYDFRKAGIDLKPPSMTDD